MVLDFLAVFIGSMVVGTTSAAHYGDYAAAKMPHYGSEEYHESAREIVPAVDEYHYRSAEVPASPDYKYEEHLNSRTIDTRIEEDWHKPTKKSPRLQRLNMEPLQKYNSDKVTPKFDSTVRRRPKSRNSQGNARLNKNPLRTGRIRSNDFIDKDDEFLSEDLYQDRFIDDKMYTKAISERVVRRKPRDRSQTSSDLENEELQDDDEEEGQRERDNAKEADYSVTEESVVLESGRNEENRAVPHRTTHDDDDLIARLEAKKLDQKKEEEYQDYYDMKRLNNIKKRITVLYRRTKARATGTTTSRRYQVWTYRRSFVLDRYATATSENEDYPTRTTARLKTKKRNKTRTETKSTNKILTATFTPTTTKRTTIVSTTTPLVKSSSKSIGNVITDLSLAEKSRLSILKKAQLKESLMDKSVTVKPPVLMQVSQRMNTMVVVEPPKQDGNIQLMGSLGGPVSDSPERLARAKILLRRKLVAGARSIHDLTENWDEMICDYLDISQLDGARGIHVSIFLSMLPLLLQFL